MEIKKPRLFSRRSPKKADREIQELNKKIEERPSDPRLHQRLAELYLEKGKNEEAISEFIKAAECHSEAGFYLRSIALYRRILRMRESAEILLRLAELYLLNGLLGDALVQFRKVIDHYRGQGKKRQILKVLQRMPKVDPGNVEIRTKYIELLQSEGFLLQAFDELVGLYKEQQNTASPESMREWEGQIRSLNETLSGYLTRAGDEKGLSHLAGQMEGLFEHRPQPTGFPAAEEGEVELVREVSDDVEYIEVVEEELEDGATARMEEAQEQDSSEIGEGAESVALSQELPETDVLQRLKEARIYMEQGLYDEAEVLYGAILDLDPRHTETLMALEELRRRREEMEEPSDPSGVLQRLKFLERGPRPKEGRRAKEEGPAQAEKSLEDPKVHLELGLAYKELGMTDECIVEFHISAADPDWAFTSHRELGACFLEKEDLEQACAHFQKALECSVGSEPQLLDVRYQLAQVYQQRGMNEEALLTYREIEEKDSSYRDVKERIESLSQ